MSCCYCLPAIRCIEQGEQLVLVTCTDKYVVNGPTVHCFGCCITHTKRSGITLKQTEFLKVTDTTTGSLEIVKGPKLHYLGAFEQIVQDRGAHQIQNAYTLGPTQYIIVQDTQTGDLDTQKGPIVWFPGPFDIILKGGILEAIALKHNEYVKIIDNLTGNIRVEKGQALIYLTPTEDILEYDQKTKGIQQAVNIDEHTAVLIRNTKNAQLRLVMKHELFFPEWNEEIVNIQKKIVLQDHETVILKDKDGTYHFKTGLSTREEKERKRKMLLLEKENKKGKKNKGKEATDQYLVDPDDEDEYERAFFIPPYCELLSLQWSDGLKKDKKKTVKIIDQRPQFMNYLFVCRTTDNVELEIDLTMFWQVLDVKRMIEKTDDPTGDICFHARSVIIQTVSKVTLERFMNEFNQIIAEAVLNPEDTFYQERGCIVHTVEMKAMHCCDPDTENVLQEIIKERTDRLNRLQKQQSENEVRLFKMKGDIEEEKLNGELLQIRYSHHRVEAEMEGEAEADQVKAFLNSLPGGAPDSLDLDTKLAIWHQLRKIDTIRSLSQGDSRLYLTPDNINLSIETFEGFDRNPRATAAKKANEKKSYSKFINDK